MKNFLSARTNFIAITGLFFVLLVPFLSLAQPTIRHGNSYVNVSKKTIGGVVEQGDTLEVRMTIHITAGTAYRVRYLDNVPANTQMLTGINDSIRMITNEGLTYKKYTLASGDDAATYIAAPPAGDYQIRLNLGFGTPVSAATTPGIPTNNSTTNTTGAAQVNGTARPRGGGGLLFATSFRVVVTGNPGDIITLGSGRLIYKNTSSGTDRPPLTATQYQILISEPADLCADKIGVNIAGEFGGTFGTGNTLNRSTGPTFPIPGYTYRNNVSASQSVGDGSYGIVNNISPISGTNRTAERTPDCTTPLPSQNACGNRMFNGHWDIDGDHSGTSTKEGNLPPGPTDPGGYMLMVNADYVASEVYRQDITGLCPNTDYEFSAWVRNICPTCGIDSLGSSYTPRNPGVLPNLTFVLDDVDRYSSGNIDTAGWIKKGFLFRTGVAQTNMTFSIRNNGQGGGGNDWAMDDITITTCLPTMSYSPSISPNICEENALTIHDTVRSYFDNYIHYIWQRSTDGGTNWINITSPAIGTPDPTGSGYQYITSYTIPPGNTTLADSADLYRVIVATTASNLSEPSCGVTDDPTNIITLNVIDCTPILKTELLTFNGKLVNDKAILSWSISKEESPLQFIIERSYNGVDFSMVGSLANYNSQSAVNHYSFIDPASFTDKAWYRLIIVTHDGKKKYSSIIQLKKNMPGFDIDNMINPFSNDLAFTIHTDCDAAIHINLTDMAGRIVLKGKHLVYTGVNNLNLTAVQNIPAGVYTLQVIYNDTIIRKQVIKK